jgi:hypothetical protein
MLLKKTISLLVLVLYLHGLSGYTMSFHTCLVTGFQNVYAGYNVSDPCQEEEEKGCQETDVQIKPADCCDVQQTNISIDENVVPGIYSFHFLPVTLRNHPAGLCLYGPQSVVSTSTHINIIRPPEPCLICIFRI